MANQILSRGGSSREVGVWVAIIAGFMFGIVGRGTAQNRNYGYVGSVIAREKKEFSFAIWGDPQVAYYEPGTKFGGQENKEVHEKVVPRLEQSVALTNELQPEFVVTLGDNIHNLGEWENFRVFVDLVKPLRMPIYLLMGNHDHVPAADTLASNPVKDREFANFVWAQRQLNGLELVVYSFDAGDWHFIMFSQPGGVGYGVDEFLTKHSEYLEWLEADLAANRNRPTMFFTHHPPLPVGRVRFDHYGPAAEHRARLVEILTRHGNVKYAFSGHVHNTVASVPLISWRYRGTSFITIPNSAYLARRDDYLETTSSSNGVLMVSLNHALCESITFKSLANETAAIDTTTFEEYDDSFYGYFVPDWALPAAAAFTNGSFEEPLGNGWFGDHLLPYNTGPVQKRRMRTDDAAEGNQALYLYTCAQKLPADTRSYVTCSVRQALAVPPLQYWPVLRLQYKISSLEYRQPELCNAFIEINGYKRGERIRRFGIGYGLGRAYSWFGVRGRYASVKLEPVRDVWHQLTIYPRSDCDRYFPAQKWENLGIEVLVVTLGVFNENYALNSEPAEMGVTFDAVEWQLSDRPTPHTVAVTEHEVEPPLHFALLQNYPNPFNPKTTFSFVVTQTAQFSLKVFDLTGKTVATLFDGEATPGTYRISWETDGNVPAGIYWAVLQDSRSQRLSAKKALVLK